MRLNSKILMYVIDNWYTFVLPLICLMALIANLINIRVFIELRHLNKSYKYMLCKSIANALYLFICSFVFLVKCGHNCSLTFPRNYYIKLYELYLFIYFASVLALIDLFMEIMIILQRLFLIINKKFIEQRSVTTFVLPLVIIAICVYSPHCYFVRIEEVYEISSDPAHMLMYNLSLVKRLSPFQRGEEKTNKTTTKGSFFELKVANPRGYELYEIVATSCFRILTLLAVIVLFNTISFYVFKRHLSQKMSHTVRIPHTCVARHNESSLNTSCQANLDMGSTIINIKGRNSEDHSLIDDSQLLDGKRTLAKEGQRDKRRRSFKANENFNRMVVWQSLLYVLGNIWFIMALLVLPFFGGRRSQYYLLFMLTMNTFLFASLGLNILIYRKFNRKFHQTFTRIFLCRSGENSQRLVRR